MGDQSSFREVSAAGRIDLRPLARTGVATGPGCSSS